MKILVSLYHIIIKKIVSIIQTFHTSSLVIFWGEGGRSRPKTNITSIFIDIHSIFYLQASLSFLLNN